MRAWILTAALAVAIIGGAVFAVAPGDDAASAGTHVTAVDAFDAGIVLDAPFAIEAHTLLIEPAHLVRSLGVPAFDPGSFEARTLFALAPDLDDYRRQQSAHSGKLTTADTSHTYAKNPRRHVKPARSNPLLC